MAICIGVAIELGFTFWAWYLTTSRIAAARSFGVYSSPSEGLLERVDSGWVGIQEARIVAAGPDTFGLGGGPHIWYVIACVWADSKTGGYPVGSPTHDFDAPGSYFVNTHEGWVLMPETSSPLFVSFWMKVFDLAGSDRPQPFEDPSVHSQPMCVRQSGQLRLQPMIDRSN